MGTRTATVGTSDKEPAFFAAMHDALVQFALTRPGIISGLCIRQLSAMDDTIELDVMYEEGHHEEVMDLLSETAWKCMQDALPKIPDSLLVPCETALLLVNIRNGGRLACH